MIASDRVNRIYLFFAYHAARSVILPILVLLVSLGLCEIPAPLR